jgi:hypothetical protein
MLKFVSFSHHRPLTVLAIVIALAPLVGLVFILLNAAVTHLCALLFGQNRRGFAATFAACAYAMAPTALCAIPACGSIIATVWVIVLTGVGLKRMHGITSGGATAATLGPYLVFCCLGCGVFAIMLSAGASAIVGLPQ